MHTHTEESRVWTDNLNMEVITLTQLRKVWIYQRCNHSPYNEEEHIIQLSKEKVQKDKQRSTKHILKTKDRVTVNIGDKLKWFWRVSSSCSTSDARRVNIVTHYVISHEWLQDNTYTALSYSWHQNMIYCEYKCMWFLWQTKTHKPVTEYI